MVKVAKLGDLGKPEREVKNEYMAIAETSKSVSAVKNTVEKDKEDTLELKGTLTMKVYRNAPVTTIFSGMLSGADIRVMRVALRRGYLKWNADKARGRA